MLAVAASAFSSISAISIFRRAEPSRPGANARTRHAFGNKLGAYYSPASFVVNAYIVPRATCVITTFLFRYDRAGLIVNAPQDSPHISLRKHPAQTKRTATVRTTDTQPSDAKTPIITLIVRRSYHALRWGSRGGMRLSTQNENSRFLQSEKFRFCSFGFARHVSVMASSRA